MESSCGISDSVKKRFLTLTAIFLALIFSQALTASSDLEDYFIFQENDKKGIRNSEDQIIIPAKYDDLGWSIGEFHPLSGVLGYKENGLWGLITLKNKKITEPQYLNLYPLNRQLIIASKVDPVNNEEMCGILDLKGNVEVDFLYGRLNMFNNQIVASRKIDSQWKFGMMNLSYQEILPFVYTDIKPLNNQYAIIKLHNVSGLVSAYGQVLVEPKYHEIEINGNDGFRGKSFDTHEIKNFRNQLIASFQLKSIEKAGEGILVAYGPEQSHLLNTRGEIITSYPKTQVFEFTNGKAVIQRNGLFGVIDYSGKEVMPPESRSIWLRDSYLGVEHNNGEWKLYKSDLTSITDRVYQEIKPAVEELFAVKRLNRWGFINHQGEEVIPPQYEEVGDFKEGVALANYLGSWGLIDKTGHWQIKPRYDRLEKIQGETYLFQTGAQYGLVKRGQQVVYRTSNPLRPAETGVIEQSEDQHYGLISLEGEQMLSLKYKQINSYPENPRYYRFEDDRGLGIFNIYQHTFFRDTAIQEIRTLHEGYIGVRINDQYGLIDLDGKLRIANRYQDVGVFNEGMLPVQIRGRWGYVDRLERLKIQPLYQTVDHFINQLAVVSRNNKFGLIDKTGKIILSLEYDQVTRLPDGQFICHQGNRAGLVDISGTVLLYPSYNSIELMESGHFKVESNGKQGVIDNNGKVLIPPSYDHLTYDEFNHLYLLTRKFPWEEIAVK